VHEGDNAGVHENENSENTGVDDLEEFVEGLEAELDDEIAEVDSIYSNRSQSSTGRELQRNPPRGNGWDTSGRNERTNDR
jgi:hypothetical protein